MTFGEAAERLLELAIGWLPNITPSQALEMDIGLLVFAVEAKVKRRAEELGIATQPTTQVPLNEDGTLDRVAVANQVTKVLGQLAGSKRRGRRK